MHTYNNIQHTVKGISKRRYLHTFFILYSLHQLSVIMAHSYKKNIAEILLKVALKTKNDPLTRKEREP